MEAVKVALGEERKAPLLSTKRRLVAVKLGKMNSSKILPEEEGMRSSV